MLFHYGIGKLPPIIPLVVVSVISLSQASSVDLTPIGPEKCCFRGGNQEGMGAQGPYVLQNPIHKTFCVWDSAVHMVLVLPYPPDFPPKATEDACDNGITLTTTNGIIGGSLPIP